MQRTLLALSCALALASGNVLAQQSTPETPSPATGNPTGGTVTERARAAAEKIGDKTREAAGKAKDKAQDTAQKAKADTDQKAAASGSSSGSKDTQAMGASGNAGSSKAEQLQKKADADHKTAKARCDSLQASQKTLCEKQADAAHANAEVQVEKARLSAQGGSTATMGAGKSAQK